MEQGSQTPGVDFKSFVASLAATAAATLAYVEELLQVGEGKESQQAASDQEAAPAEAQKPGTASAEAKQEDASPEERAEGVRNGLTSARQLIGTLAMLEQKTRGNLTHDEQQLLQSSLTQLRFGYVRLLDRSRAGGKGDTPAL